MSGSRGVDRRSGFTLIEVLIAVVLLGLLMGVVINATRLGIGAWAGAERLTTDDADVVAAEAFLRRSIVTAVPSFADAHSADPTIVFDGQPDNVMLVGPWPGTDGNGPWVRMRLFVAARGRGRALYLAWEPDLPPSGADVPPPQTAVLLDHVAALRLSYFGTTSPQDAPAWVPTWTGRAELPALVRIGVLREGPARRSWPDMVAAPRATMNASCVYDAVNEDCRKAR